MVHLLLDKIEENRSYFFVIDDGLQDFVKHLEAEAYRPCDLSPDGAVSLKIPGKKTIEDRGIFGRKREGLRLLHLRKVVDQLFHKLRRIEDQPPFFKIDGDSREVLGRLDIHIFVQAHVGELRPEGNVPAQGKTP